jgi:hypothetical protein
MKQKRLTAVGVALLVALNVALALYPRVVSAADDGNRVCQCSAPDPNTGVVYCSCATYFQSHCWTPFFCY